MPEPRRAEDGESVRALARGLDVVGLLRDRPQGAGLAPIARELALSKATASRYLDTLVGKQFVERDGDRFRLGTAFRPTPEHTLEILLRRARPRLEALRDRFDETIAVALLRGRDVVYVDVVRGKRSTALRLERGERDWVHATAAGKAISAHLPEDEVHALLELAGMEALTTQTCTDPGQFLEELAVVRDRGWALDDRERDADARAVAVAVMPNEIPAAISLGVPAVRMPPERIEEVAGLLTRLAADLLRAFDRGERQFSSKKAAGGTSRASAST